jgi:peptidoglycan/LPS O-acetylase OafA/YrhL
MGIKTNKRLEYLDSARGLAAIFVVWGHFLFQYGVQDNIPAIAHSPLRIFYNAIPAVSFFFVLSGMVLSFKYFAKPVPINYKEYVIARLFRIYPAFLVVLLISFIIQAFFYKQAANISPIADGRDFWAGTIPAVGLMKEAFLFLNLQGSSSLVSQRWSLIVEIQISLLMPFMVLIAQRGIKWLFAFAFCIIIFLHDAFSSIYFMHFALGLFIAYRYKEIISRWSEAGKLSRIIFFTAGLLLYNYRYMIPYLQQAVLPGQVYASIAGNELIIRVSEGVGAAILLMSLVGSDLLKKILSHKYLTFIGRVSYSIYLCHFIILLAITPYCIMFLNNAGVSHRFTLLGIALVITTILVLALSVILYYLVEKPFIRTGKMVASKYATNP